MIRAKGGAKLVELDARRENLPLAQFFDQSWPLIADNDKAPAAEPVLLTKEHLLDVIVEWKFLKGKPRNALRPLLKSNTDASVAAASRRAFVAVDGIPKISDASSDDDNRNNYAKEITAAMNHLCEIRGVGPATASAVLCLYRPDVFAFMDDEVIECLYDGKRGYTLKIYLEVNDRCREIASQLNTVRKERKDDSEGFPSSSSGGGWTPCKVGMALWTVAIMSSNDDDRGLSTIFNCDAPFIGGGCGSDEKNGTTHISRKRTKKG
jgi:hypothetical protein